MKDFNKFYKMISNEYNEIHNKSCNIFEKHEKKINEMGYDEFAENRPSGLENSVIMLTFMEILRQYHEWSADVDLEFQNRIKNASINYAKRTGRTIIS